MGIKKAAKSVGSGVANAGKAVGKGVYVASAAVVSKTFLIAQIVGLVFTIAGLIIVVYMSFQKVSVVKMNALFKMITGVVFALCGIILIGVSYGIRWKHRMINRVTEIEKKLGIQPVDDEDSQEILEEEPVIEEQPVTEEE